MNDEYCLTLRTDTEKFKPLLHVPEEERCGEVWHELPLAAVTKEYVLEEYAKMINSGIHPDDLAIWKKVDPSSLQEP